MAWYSRLKGEYVLTLKEYDDCHRIFREKGMRTFGDWLEYYNNLDVASLPGGAPEDEGVLHRPWGGHLQGRGLPPGCIQAVPLAQDAAASPGLQTAGALHPQQRGVRDAEGLAGRRAESCFHPQARGGGDPHPLPPVRGCKGVQAHPGVRR